MWKEKLPRKALIWAQRAVKEIPNPERVEEIMGFFIQFFSCTHTPNDAVVAAAAVVMGAER